MVGRAYARYFSPAHLEQVFATIHATCAIWPPTGIALAALLLFGYRAWPAIFAGAFLVNVTTSGSILVSIAIAAGNTAEGLVGAYLVGRFARGPACFERVADVFKFAGLAAGAATMVSATVGVLALVLASQAGWGAFASIWLTWWLGDATGALIFAPPIVLWFRDRSLHVPEGGLCRGVVLIDGALVMASACSASQSRC